VVSFLLAAGRTKVLAATAILIALVAVADWTIGTRASLGPLYIVPMIVGALVLGSRETAVLAILCSILRMLFDVPSPPLETALRFVFATLAYASSGMFVSALIHNRALAMEHLARISREQALRKEAEQHVKDLVESSPAAILTMDGSGIVLASNVAARSLFLMPKGDDLIGKPIAGYVPLLADALKVGGDGGFRTAAQCPGRRANGEIFLAHTWFSSYSGPGGKRLAAIVVDSSEEMREREEEGLRQLMRGNRLASAATSHEVRNASNSILLLCSNLSRKYELAEDEDFRGLAHLAGGLQKLASFDLHGTLQDTVEEVSLKEVLDDLRIVVEPEWREIDGEIEWEMPGDLPAVLADRHGLLQVFLNLAKNSHRAVQDCPIQKLRIMVSQDQRVVRIRVQDSGPGISDPERLFQPFQDGADGIGLGLYLSRTMLRSYGGDLRFEPGSEGTCFRVDLLLP
jgi:signal transduction histidine kinase